MVKGLAALVATVLLPTFSLGPPRLMAEEILITGNGIHLGWVTAKNTFTTCRKMIMEIGEGRIEGTKNRCPFLEKTSLVKGLVDNIDEPNQTLWIKDEGGQIQELFFFDNAESSDRTRLNDFEKGDKVIVTVPSPGRGEFIRTREQAK